MFHFMQVTLINRLILSHSSCRDQNHVESTTQIEPNEFVKINFSMSHIYLFVLMWHKHNYTKKDETKKYSKVCDMSIKVSIRLRA